MATSITDFVFRDIFRIISRASGLTGIGTWVVGPYVRDCFRGVKNNHIDIVTEGDAIAFGKTVAGIIHSKVSVYKNFGTAIIYYKGDTVSFAQARRERFSREKKNAIAPGSIYEDLRARDFTVNTMAIALKPEDFGHMEDVFGGLKDLSLGVIRTPDLPEESFRDDPLRMLRAVRLASELSTESLKFRLVPECLEAIRKCADRINLLSKERIVEELNRILLCDVPSEPLYILDSLEVLQRIIPSVSSMKGIQKVKGVGHEDSFLHTLAVLDNIARLEAKSSAEVKNSLGIKQGEPNLWLRWAALLHDIGKQHAKRFEPGRGWTFHGYEVISTRMVPKIFKELKMPQNEKMHYVQKLVSLQKRPLSLLDEGTSESAYRRLLADAGDDIDDLLLLCLANVTTANKAKAAKEQSDMSRIRQGLMDVKEKDAIKYFKIPIDANYIMDLYGLEPCNALGVLKNHIKTAILNGEIGNNFEDADALLRKKATEIGLKTKEEKKEEEEQAKAAPAPSNDAPKDILTENPVPAQTNESVPEETLPNGASEERSEHHSQATSPDEIPAELGIPEKDETDLAEIVRIFNENGIFHLFYFTTPSELEMIRNNGSIVNDRIVLRAQDVSTEMHEGEDIVLMIDLNALFLPGTLMTSEAMVLNGIILGAAIRDLKILKQCEGSRFLPTIDTGHKNILSDCVIIVPNSIPAEYIENLESASEESIVPLEF